MHEKQRKLSESSSAKGAVGSIYDHIKIGIGVVVLHDIRCNHAMPQTTNASNHNPVEVVSDDAVLHIFHPFRTTAAVLDPIGVIGLIRTAIEHTLLDTVGSQLLIRVGCQFVERQSAGVVEGSEGTVEIVFVEVNPVLPKLWPILLLQRPVIIIVEIDEDGVNSGLINDSR